MRGRGFWKLNTSFLKDEEYIKKIQSIITQTKDEYAQDNTITPNLLWETIKMKVRETSIEFGRINKRKLFQKQDDIEKTIKILGEQTANTDVKRLSKCIVRARKDGNLKPEPNTRQKGLFQGLNRDGTMRAKKTLNTL